MLSVLEMFEAEEMFSPEFTHVLESAYQVAIDRKHAYFCVEHLLYSLMLDHDVAKVITACGGDPEQVRRDIENNFFSRGIAGNVGENGIEDAVPVQTPAVNRVLEGAFKHAHALGSDSVTSQDVLLSIFDEADSHAVYFLKRQGISRLDIFYCGK